MGGSGSGNWLRWTSARCRVEDKLNLPISQFRETLKQAVNGRTVGGSLTWRRGENVTASIGFEALDPLRLRLHYTVGRGTADERRLDYFVNVTTTRPYYGGVRNWFLCPRCGRRCGVLYGPDLFACRLCHGLAYESSQTAHRMDSLIVPFAIENGMTLREAKRAFREAFENPYDRKRSRRRRRFSDR